MNNIYNLIIAVLPIIGVIIGAGLQYFFSRFSESRKQLSTFKSLAYVDYLRCVAESKHVGRDNTKARKEIFAKAADAKARIAVYGSSNVVDALAHFEKEGAIINSRQSEEKFLALCKAMRRENIGKDDKTKIEALRLVLFGMGEWND